MNILGDKNIFALEYAFASDPDKGRGATAEESLSWGQFALWVEGKNLCQFMYDGERNDSVHWYVLPLLEWLASNWGALLYEEAPPTPTEKDFSARSIFFEYGKLRFGFMPENEEALWYDWGQRHSLRACASGGIFPDVYLRGAGDKVEISWGNATLPGYPENLFFTAPAAVAFPPRNTVHAVLYAFLRDASGYLRRQSPDSQRIIALQKNVAAIPGNITEHISWMIPFIRKQRVKFSDILERVKHFIPHFDLSVQIPAAILMFGSCSPEVHHEDIDTILQNISSGYENQELTDLVHSIPFSMNERPYTSGYNAAQSFSDQFSTAGDFVDIEKILDELSINIIDVEFSDHTMRGIALAGDGLMPTIFVNTAYPNNMTDQGRRYSLAHEFCHLLHDRQYGHEVGVVSGPWAPKRIEQRANAFAAMLLMPVTMIERMIAPESDIDLDLIHDMARTLRVSRAALIEHLHNIGAVTMLQRDALREQSAQEESETSQPRSTPGLLGM